MLARACCGALYALLSPRAANMPVVPTRIGANDGGASRGIHPSTPSDLCITLVGWLRFRTLGDPPTLAQTAARLTTWTFHQTLLICS